MEERITLYFSESSKSNYDSGMRFQAWDEKVFNSDYIITVDKTDVSFVGFNSMLERNIYMVEKLDSVKLEPNDFDGWVFYE